MGSYCQERKISRNKFSVLLGINSSMVYEWCDGVFRVDPQKMPLIKEKLNLSDDEYRALQEARWPALKEAWLEKQPIKNRARLLYRAYSERAGVPVERTGFDIIQLPQITQALQLTPKESRRLLQAQDPNLINTWLGDALLDGNPIDLSAAKQRLKEENKAFGGTLKSYRLRAGLTLRHAGGGTDSGQTMAWEHEHGVKFLARKSIDSFIQHVPVLEEEASQLYQQQAALFAMEHALILNAQRLQSRHSSQAESVLSR